MSGITPLPTPPSTSDPSNFSTRADAFLPALQTFGAEVNDLVAALNNISTTSTSVTSNTIGTGSKAFTVQTGKSYFPGQSVTIARTGAPTNRMFARVDSYNSGTGALAVTSQAFEGSGTFTDWTITLGFNGIISAGQIANAAVTLAKLAPDVKLGKVLQVVQGTTSTPVTNSTAGFVATGLSASITPSSASSKILVLVNQNTYSTRTANQSGYGFRVLRNSTVIQAANSDNTDSQGAIGGASAVTYGGIHSASVLDSPATTSAITYSVTARPLSTGSSGSITHQYNNSVSSIILMEIAA